MSKAVCFDPQMTENCRILVLGSMPGKISLAQNQYYAHPRNNFWPIMARIFNFSDKLTYSEKLDTLNQAGVGLWDVIATCYREGSLDTAIQTKDLVVNDFKTCFERFPKVERVLLNGQKAGQLFKQKVAVPLMLTDRKIDWLVLPSTSPAHASVKFEEKLFKWQQACNFKQST